MSELRKYLKQWLACRRLNRLVARRRAEEALYMQRRMAAQLGWERRRQA